MTLQEKLWQDLIAEQAARRAAARKLEAARADLQGHEVRIAYIRDCLALETEKAVPSDDGTGTERDRRFERTGIDRMTLTPIQRAWLVAVLEGRAPKNCATVRKTATEFHLRRRGMLDTEGALTPAGRDRAIVEQGKAKRAQEFPEKVKPPAPDCR